VTDILSKLTFDAITSRYEDIDPAHEKTFRWKYTDDTDLPMWLEEGEGTYWINGKAGSGKSTLMKALYDDEKTRQRLLKWQGFRGLIFAAFFFHGRGTTLQQSQDGLLRSILHQILQQHRHFIPTAYPRELEELEYLNAKHRLKHWTERQFDQVDIKVTRNELKKTLATILRQTQEKVDIFLMIDGLDEYRDEGGCDKEESYEDIVQFFKSITGNKAQQRLRLKVCLSSRPLTVFHTAFSNGPTLQLQDLTKDDIRFYIESTLGKDTRMQAIQKSNPEKTQALFGILKQKASGVFLWVTLVVKILLRGLRNGDDIERLLKHLDQLPSKLEDLFKQILGDISDENRGDACKFFRLVRCALRPPTLLCVSYAMDGPSAAICAERKTTDVAFEAEINEQMRRRIMSRCLGLLEAPSKDASPVVQYLHLTVKDYLEKPEVAEWTDAPSQGTDFKPVVSMLSATIRLLKTTHFDLKLREDAKALWVLRNEAMMYAELAESETGQAQTALLEQLTETESYRSGGRWHVDRYKYAKGSSSLSHNTYDHDNFLSFAILAGLMSYVIEYVNANTIDVNAKIGRPYLEYALAPVEKIVGKNLVLITKPPNISMIIFLLEKGADPNLRYDGMTVWQRALEKGLDPNILQLLLEFGALPNVHITLSGPRDPFNFTNRNSALGYIQETLSRFEKQKNVKPNEHLLALRETLIERGARLTAHEAAKYPNIQARCLSKEATWATPAEGASTRPTNRPSVAKLSIVSSAKMFSMLKGFKDMVFQVSKQKESHDDESWEIVRGELEQGPRLMI